MINQSHQDEETGCSGTEKLHTLCTLCPYLIHFPSFSIGFPNELYILSRQRDWLWCHLLTVCGWWDTGVWMLVVLRARIMFRHLAHSFFILGHHVEYWWIVLIETKTLVLELSSNCMWLLRYMSLSIFCPLMWPEIMESPCNKNHISIDNDTHIHIHK